MNRHGCRRVYRALLVDGVTQHIKDATQSLLTYRNGDWCAGVIYVKPSRNAVGHAHGNGSNHAVAQLLLHFKRKTYAGYVQRVVYLGDRFAWKFHVDNCANDLNNFTTAHS